MSATVSKDFRFEPVVWSAHTMAYYDEKLVYGNFAVKNNELEVEGTGTVINFPYYNAIGPAEEPKEDESLSVDNLTDDSFSTSVFEVGKAVGVKKKAFYASADKINNIVKEVNGQMGRVHAERIDLKLNNEITSYDGSGPHGGGEEDSGTVGPIGNDPALYDNMTIGYVATEAAHTMNIRALLRARVRAFGDKSEEAQVCFMHPLQFMDSLIDEKAGFLRADANDPLSAVNGYIGRYFNMAIITVESCKRLPNKIGGKAAYLAHFHKMNSYGIIHKQKMEYDMDSDKLAREKLFITNQWYGVKSFDRKINRKDKKAGGIITTVSEELID